MSRAVVVALLATFTACTAAPPPPTSPQLGEVVAAVWPAGSLPRGANVTWTLGDPTPGADGWTQAHCVLTACTFTVTIRPTSIDPGLIAHEGGHVICISLWLDNSEECADRNAAELTVRKVDTDAEGR